jgi:Spy/CpxP family protein refolding chaperone
MTILIQALLIAQATTVSPSPAAAASSAQVPKEKLICHMEDIGQTRIAQRICHTKAQWDQIERETEDDVSANKNKQNDTGNPPE